MKDKNIQLYSGDTESYFTTNIDLIMVKEGVNTKEDLLVLCHETLTKLRRDLHKYSSPHVNTPEQIYNQRISALKLSEDINNWIKIKRQLEDMLIKVPNFNKEKFGDFLLTIYDKETYDMYMGFSPKSSDEDKNIIKEAYNIFKRRERKLKQVDIIAQAEREVRRNSGLNPIKLSHQFNVNTIQFTEKPNKPNPIHLTRHNPLLLIAKDEIGREWRGTSADENTIWKRTKK